MILPLIVSRPEGLYCPEGEFFIDPWRPVDRAVITHAHSDHARRGNTHYLAHRDSAELLRIRLGADISLQTLEYGEVIEHSGVRISLHPAGHVLGSAQVRLERKGRVWVASGDYKLADQFLHQVATKTGGRLYEANERTQLTEAFSKIAEELRHQYSIGYYPLTTLQSGERRELRVRVDRPDLAVRARDSYVQRVTAKP